MVSHDLYVFRCLQCNAGSLWVNHENYEEIKRLHAAFRKDIIPPEIAALHELQEAINARY